MKQRPQVTKQNEQLIIGAGRELPSSHLELLARNSPKSDDILDNVDALREEIEESHPEFLETPTLNTAAQEETMTITESDFEKDLAAFDSELEKKKASQEEQEYVPEEEMIKRQLLQLLKETENAPTEAQIDAWKRQYGNTGVHLLGLAQGDVYVFTHVKRGQWQKIQEMIKKAASAGFDAEEQLKEKVLGYCVLWPRPLGPEFFSMSRGGVVDALFDAIMQQSYFLNPQQVMMLTTTL